MEGHRIVTPRPRKHSQRRQDPELTTSAATFAQASLTTPGLIIRKQMGVGGRGNSSAFHKPKLAILSDMLSFVSYLEKKFVLDLMTSH